MNIATARIQPVTSALDAVVGTLSTVTPAVAKYSASELFTPKTVKALDMLAMFFEGARRAVAGVAGGTRGAAGMRRGKGLQGKQFLITRLTFPWRPRALAHPMIPQQRHASCAVIAAHGRHA